MKTPICPKLEMDQENMPVLSICKFKKIMLGTLSKKLTIMVTSIIRYKSFNTVASKRRKVICFPFSTFQFEKTPIQVNVHCKKMCIQINTF